MDLFPKSNEEIFRRRIVPKYSEYDVIETASPKLQLERLEKALLHGTAKNDEMFEREMSDTLERMNNFLHGLEIASTLHDRRKLRKEQKWAKYKGFEQQYRNKIMLGHTLKEKMKELLDLEDSGVRLSKSFKSPSIRTIEINYLGEGSEGNISSCSRYGSEINEVLHRLNQVLSNSPIFPRAFEFHTPKTHNKTREETDVEEFLTERLAMDNIQPIFTSHPLKPSESSHTVSCKIFNIVVEGRASEKSAAKKAAALNMLERIIEDNANGDLPSQITPFADFEIQDAMRILCEMQMYDTKLANLCLERHKRMPQYTNHSARHSLRTHCSALGLQGVGTHTNPVMARRLAAREVLLQLRQDPTC